MHISQLVVLCTISLTSLVASASLAPDAVAAPSASAVRHTALCGANLTFYTPIDNERKFTDTAIGLPPGSNTLIAAESIHGVRWLTNLECKSVVKKLHLPKPTAVATSGNWAGYQLHATAPSYGTASWTVPSINTLKAPGNAYSNAWVGLGAGTSRVSDELVQAGTEHDLSCSTKGGSCVDPQPRTDFWFEQFPKEAEVELTSFTPSPGDAVVISVNYSGKSVFYLFCDNTKNTCVTISETAAATPGNLVEWIVERPSLGAMLPPLADFKSITMSSAGFNSTSNTNTSLAQGGARSITMVNNGTVLAKPGTLTADGRGFTTTWKAYS